MTVTTFHLGLIGFPLEQSLSPKIHMAALQACGLKGDYHLFPVAPDDRQSLKDLLARVRAGELHGLNVTIPHKQTVIPYLDELTPVADSIGAVNTIYLQDDKLIGDNTDAPGFLADLKRLLTTETPGHGELNALVLGAGGSARAVVYALLNAGWMIHVAARRPEQAEVFAGAFTENKLQITNFEFSSIDLSSITLIVNTTPVGMIPRINQSPWPQYLPFPPHAAVYDLVYNPRETQLVREACLQGLRARSGLGMLIEQAVLAFEKWTGLEPPREAIAHALKQTQH